MRKIEGLPSKCEKSYGGENRRKYGLQCLDLPFSGRYVPQLPQRGSSRADRTLWREHMLLRRCSSSDADRFGAPKEGEGRGAAVPVSAADSRAGTDPASEAGSSCRDIFIIAPPRGFVKGFLQKCETIFVCLTLPVFNSLYFLRGKQRKVMRVGGGFSWQERIFLKFSGASCLFFPVVLQ